MSRNDMIDDNDYTFDDEHPDFGEEEDSECEYCTALSEDLEYVESGDESVGHREGWMLCPKCREGRK